MVETLFIVGDVAVTVGQALIALATLALILLVVVAVKLGRAARERRSEAAAEAVRSEQIEQRMASLARIQAETVGRLHSMGETFSGRQAELGRVVNERLDAVTHRLGQSMEATTRHTVESLRHLHERLAVIDNAQKNLTELSAQVTSLREVLANKQARGAFGQARMEAIVRDGLPKGAYEFQFTLSNRTRPDCVVFLPVDQRPLVIDAKFPLEAVTAFREGKTDEAKKQAAQRLRQDVLKHITDIAERYLIPGETQELALMFVPSESVYAELHDGFDDLIQKAYRAQVVLVSPSLLMLAIQVMQQICKDARMREAAHEIRTEVGHLVGDLDRLRERVLKLQQHFGQANDDVAQILISADKITKRGGRIEALEFDAEETPREARLVMPTPIGPKIDAAE
ncbi:MAG: DNA recombination protein RmuC [Xanthobacteraceae bacterium]|jgi:DNA recombination protein RmuC